MSGVEELIERLKSQVFKVLADKPLSLKELYNLARIVKVLVELEAEFVEDLDSWLPYDLISSCIDPLLEPYSLEDEPRGEFYIGVDLGKHVDYSVVAVVMHEGAKLKLVHLHRFPLKTPYANVIGYVKALCKNYHRVKAVYVDQTGVGE